ncbi:hypothetical protein [Streptomyces zingiberis]|nr:hypothetical protein [Streptomyces zingiberis]
MESSKVLHDCRPGGEAVHRARLGIGRPYNLTFTSRPAKEQVSQASRDHLSDNLMGERVWGLPGMSTESTTQSDGPGW